MNPDAARPTTIIGTSSRREFTDKTVIDFMPPPLHDPTIPATTSQGNLPTQDIYKTIHEARRQIDLADGEARFRSSLMEYPDFARAIYSVLLESHKIVGEDGKVVAPPPMNPPPQLPVGYRSWLQPKKKF